MKAFWIGFSSAFNIFGNTKAVVDYITREDNDYEALSSDWKAVGGDFSKAMGGTEV